VACDMSNKDWQSAIRYDTIGSYEEYISRYPQNSMLDSARYYLEDEIYLEAKIRNNIPHYENLLKDYPHSRFRAEVNKEIRFLKNQWHDSIRNVNKITVIVNDSYNKRTESTYPFIKIIKIIFQDMAGIEVNYNLTERTGTVLNISCNYKPIGNQYYGNAKEIKGIQYTSARLQGYISIEKDNSIVMERKFYGVKEPLKNISWAHPVTSNFI